VKNRQKVFDKISLLIDAMNREVLGYLGIKFEKREYYGAAEPPVRCGESHLSGLTEPPHFVY